MNDPKPSQTRETVLRVLSQAGLMQKIPVSNGVYLMFQPHIWGEDGITLMVVFPGHNGLEMAVMQHVSVSSTDPRILARNLGLWLESVAAGRTALTDSLAHSAARDALKQASPLIPQMVRRCAAAVQGLA